MTRNKSSIFFTLLAALMAVFLIAAPAIAGGKKGSSETQYTEDNDTNDGGTANNVEDDGDNAHPSGKDRSVENGKSGNQGNSTSDPDDDGRGPDRSNGGPDKANGSGGVDKADQDGNNGCGNDDDFEDDNEGWCGKPTDKEDKVKSNDVCAKDHWMENNSPKCDEVESDNVCEEDETMPAGHGDECEEVEGSDEGKITICHATGSMTNPFVVITIDENGLNGHGDHEGDIIPAPEGECDAEVLGEEEVAPCVEDVDMEMTEPCEVVPEVDDDTVLPGDEVLGGSLSQPGEATGEAGPSVLGAAAEADEDGGVLPFTGGAVLPFLLVAGALIGAGVYLFRRDRTESV